LLKNAFLAIIMRMSQHTHNTHDWSKIEHLFLWVFVVSRFVLLWHRWGMSIGFDNDEHLEMVGMWNWTTPILDIDKTFYAYHPPLGFLTARAVSMLGFENIVSVQLASFAMSFIAFMFLRMTLRRLGLLWKPGGIAFLYITSSIPLQLFLATSFNLDVFILAAASVALYLSMGMHWKDTWFARLSPITHGATLAVVIGAAMLTKFSGVLLLAIPFAAAVFTPGWARLHRRFATSAAVAAMAMLMVAPYYYGRYYVKTGEVFPSNNTLFIRDELEAARDVRDQDPIGYIEKFFLPTTAHAIGYEHRDTAQPRLFDTWKDFWIPDNWLTWQPNLAEMYGRPQYSQSRSAQFMSYFYIISMPFVVAAGLVLFLLSWKHNRLWRRFGMVILGFSTLQILSLVYFVFSQPLAWAIPAKGIYVAPSLWGAGFLLCMPAAFHWKSPAFTLAMQRVTLSLAAAFMLVNHLLPVY